MRLYACGIINTERRSAVAITNTNSAEYTIQVISKKPVLFFLYMHKLRTIQRY